MKAGFSHIMGAPFRSGPGRSAREGDVSGGPAFYNIRETGGLKMETMEVMQLLTQAVGSLGFPIVMSILLFNQLKKEQELHKEEVASLKDAINDLRLTLASLREVKPV